MSVSINLSVVEQFSFNGKAVRSMYVKGTGECLVASDIYKAVDYDKENGKKAIQSLVPKKYKITAKDVNSSIEKGEEIFSLNPDTVLKNECSTLNEDST